MQEFLLKLEKLLQTIMQDNFPNEWDENHLTFEFTKGFRKKFSNFSLDLKTKRLEIESHSYKLTGNQEKDRGDIGLILRIKYAKDQTIEGVAFLEAKKRYIGKTNFGAMNQAQLNNIHKKSPHSQLLLYDYDPIYHHARFPELLFPVYPYLRYGYRFYFDESRSFTYAASMPISLALQLNLNNTLLYQWSQPLSYQIAFRYFFGYDLDFTPEAISEVKGFSEKTRAPAHLLYLKVAHDGSKTLREDDINFDLYERNES